MHLNLGLKISINRFKNKWKNPYKSVVYFTGLYWCQFLGFDNFLWLMQDILNVGTLMKDTQKPYILQLVHL